MVNLSECQKIQMKDDNRQVISVGDVVLIEEDKVSRFGCRIGLVERLIYGKDGAARGAVVRVSKICREISRPVNKLYPIESIENKKKEMNDASKTIELEITQEEKQLLLEMLKDVLWWGSVTNNNTLACSIKDKFNMMRN